MSCMRVLICEDDPAQAELLQDMLFEAGHRPLGPARRFVDALEIADAGRIDAAIVDLNLADGRSGPMIAKHLEARGVRVIVLSGQAEVDPDLAAVPHVFLMKPFRPAIIATLLRQPVAA